MIARVLRLLAATLVALFGLAAAGASWLAYGDRSLPSAAVEVTVDKGWSTADIAAQLERQGVVRSGLLFRFFARVVRPGLSIEAALYTFPAHESLTDVLNRLAAGGRALEVWVTIPEGYTAAQIAHRLEARGLFPTESFKSVAMTQTLVIDSARSKNLEGFLFPDTYAISRGATPVAVASMMTKQFLKELPADHAAASRRLHFNAVQIVTIASLVEREAKIDAERALMAGVYYNRLRRGMPLEVDATIEYALPAHKTALSFGDLAVDSPYNTYTHTGLPPTPIANPGKKSIAAAFHPANTDYLYYVYKGNGRHQFSKTLEEQQRAEQQYLH